MALYFLNVKVVSRGKGSKATKGAAYRAGEFIRDERSGAVYNHTDRTDVAHAEIVLPTGRADQADMRWALERRLGRSIPAGDAIRAQYRERVEARSKGPEELARVVKRQKEEGRERAIPFKPPSAGRRCGRCK